MLTHFQVIDSNIRAALLRFLQREKLPYRSHANALIALGYQRNDKDLKYLLEAAQDDNRLGQYGLTRAGALKGTYSN
jgi:isocitrate dehydrogenase kinase/phosphatase